MKSLAAVVLVLLVAVTVGCKAEPGEPLKSMSAALSDLDTDKPAGKVIVDQLHNNRLEAARSLAERIAIVREPWHLAANRQAAIRRVNEEAEEQSAAFFAAKKRRELSEVATVIGDLNTVLRDKILANATLLRVDECISYRDCNCATANLEAARNALPADRVASYQTRALTVFGVALDERLTSGLQADDLQLRRARLSRALDEVPCYSALVGKELSPEMGSKITAAKETHAHVVAKLDKLEAANKAAQEKAERADEKAERAQEAKAEKERKATEKARAAEERRQRRANRGLVCRDGTLSPSCSCYGSHQGCCSHHGGVAGCE